MNYTISGTGIYDINEYPYLSQATVNIIFRNEFEENIKYDSTMNLAEDEKFNTTYIMKKRKIGFCKEAIYYYRRHGNSASATTQNPYYCFEQFMSYFEYLIKQYKDGNGKICAYIQNLILQSFKWRIKSDLLLPYHFNDADYTIAIERIKNVLKHIDVLTIVNKPNMSIYHKLYVLKLRESKIELCRDSNNEFFLKSEGKNVFYIHCINLFFNRFKIKKNKIYCLGYIKSPICNVRKPALYIYCNDKNKEKIELSHSNLEYYDTTIKTSVFYKFEYCINLEETRKIRFEIKVDDQSIPVHLKFKKKSSLNVKGQNKEVITPNKRYIITYTNKTDVIKIKNADKASIKRIKSKKRKMYNSHVNIFRYLAQHQSPIWIYTDRKGVIDNAYYQFKHDVNKKDGIKRYYLIDGKKDKYENLFTKKELSNNVIRRKSFKHKIAYLGSDKILTSFDTFSIYSPFKIKGIERYNDILHYDMIYLQHGILYANLICMYSKETTYIDKIVISSQFEKENLINNYLYNEEDLIETEMPRFDIAVPTIEKKQNKILFAPSWRKYLIGDPPINGKRELCTEAFLNSNFYLKVKEVLESETLSNILEENNIRLEFKLHPNFEPYKKYFKINSKYIMHSEKNVNNEEYSLFITDFSSFQFDFARLNTPIIYFVPDNLEFKAGLHTYRKLDLPLEEAFGEVTFTVNDLVDKIKYYIENKFSIEEKYEKRMNTFFFNTNNRRENLYNELMKDN